ncbi:MAG: CHRD domain-containing protein, partial [Rivularia sp. (in: cyanobacteria)]
TGVVGYGFGNFEIYPTQAFTVTDSTIQPETTNLTGGADKLTVARYNVLNLDHNDADGDTEVADGRFSEIANQIVTNLNAPDIIGLQEIQDNTGSDNDGITAADQTLQQLVDAIATAGGPTYSFIDNTFIGENTSGGQPGGNIRTAFLYNGDRVDFVDGSLTAITDAQAQQTDSSNPFFDSRLPLAAKFTFNGEEVTVVNNHFSSKGGSAPILGVEQPFEARQEDVNVNGSLDERQDQAQAVKGYVDGILAEDADANVVVLGDLNEFEFVSPVEILAESLTNLTETVSENERYSFNFQGNSQSLDHILVSDNLADNAEFDIVHVNSEFADTSAKASDHDPLVASLSISNQNVENNYQNMLNFAGTIKLEGAEISAYDSGTQRIFVTGEAGEDNAFNIAEDSPILQAVDVSDPSNPTVIRQIDLSSYGAGVQSVAVKNGVVAVAVSAQTSTDPGKVVFFNASDYSELSQVTVGALPDMLTFTPDGSKVLVANEGEPNDRFTVDPEGSVSIIDVSGGFANLTDENVTTADFSEFNGQEATLRSQGVRIFGEKSDGTPSTAAEDFEPEYIAVSPDGTAAFVALQENNAFAVVDIESSKVTSILPLGYKDWSGTNPTLKPFKATFDGSQEVTPNSSTATGNALLQLNQAGNALNYTMTVSGLDFGTLVGGAAQTADTGDDVTGIHFHNAARGVGGPVVFGIFGPAQDTDDRTITINADGTTTISGVWETTDTAASTSLTNFVADLQSANQDADTNLYLNIHTEEFPMGEIRGQIMGSTVQLDASNEDGGINFANYPNLFGMYQPDAIASYEANGETYYITANEGDARIRPDGDIEDDAGEVLVEEGTDFNEEARVGDVTLDPTAFPNAATLQEDENLGRLNITTTLGNTDNDPEFEQLYAYGARSFSIFNSSGELVYDSGDLIGKLTSQLVPEKFNSQGDADSFDSRSDDKGAEPEGVTIGQVGNKTYAYVGLERTGGVMVFDVSNPTAASFVQYINNEGDLSPEGLTFIDAQDSANGNSLLAVTNEESETLTIYNANIPDLVTETPETFTLQILHASDLEGGVDAIDRSANFAAIVDYLEDEVDNSITLSAGDNYLSGPFFSAAGDRTFRDDGVFNNVYNDFYNLPQDVDNDGDADTYGSLREGGGRVDISIMNAIGFDASAFGNHEFDLGTDTIEDIIAPDYRGAELSDDRWVGSQFPYLSANLDFSNSNLAGLYTSDILPSTAFESGPEESLASTNVPKIAPATVIEEGGEKIGVVGATTPLLRSISSPGDVQVLGSGNDMDALAAVLQPLIDQLVNDQGVNKVVLVSHLQQIALEKELIGKLSGVDVVIAGGSDTLQADSEDVARGLNPGDTPAEDYPFVTTNKDGDTAVIVSTDGEYSYVGRLVVDFDAEGKVIADSIDENVSGAFATTEAQVQALWGEEDAFGDETKGELVKQLTDAVDGIVTAKDGNVFGETDVFLEGRRGEVRTEETNLGNLTADANLAYAKELDPSVTVSIKNGGGIRAPIGFISNDGDELPTQENGDIKEEGEISQLDIENSLRFNNELSLLTVTAAELKQILEHAVAASGGDATPGQFPQVGGIKFSFDTDNQAIEFTRNADGDVTGVATNGDRVRSLAITDEDGNIQDVVVEEGEVVGDASREIRLVTLNFLAGGGDSYPFPFFGENRVDLTEQDIAAGEATFAETGTEQDALAEYLVDNFSTEAFDMADVAPAQDMRIQNLGLRSDTVLEGFVEQPPVGDAIAATTLADGTIVESIDLTGFTGQATVNYTISREADFDNEVYFYKVDDINGSVNGVGVGENGYLQAALARLASPEFSTSDDNTETGSVQFDAGSIVVPLIIADGNISEALSGVAEVYFPYLGANTDNGTFDHIKFLDDSTFGFEDLPNGGDADFNDIIIKIESIA